MYYDVFESPVGKLTVSTDGEYITETHIEGDRYFIAIPLDCTRDKNHPLLQQIKQELAEYFAGTRNTFDVPLKPTGTVFQQQVWRALEKIPKGSISTYGEIATRIGNPKAVRAVGTAIGKNPICIMIPCHRVLASNGSLGGFVAGAHKKKALLQNEGVHGSI